MSEQTEATKGFSVLEVILVVLVVTIVSFGGLYIWQKNKADIKQSATNSFQTTKSQNNDSDEQLDPSERDKYLVIKEWDVRFPLTEELRGDVKYGIFKLNNGDQIAYFASNKITTQSPGGTCDLAESQDSYGSGIFGGTIAVTRSSNKEDDMEGLQFRNGDYWYVLGFSNGGACYEGDTGQEKGEFNSFMDDAIRQLETYKSN